MPTKPELLATFGDDSVLSRFGVSVGVAFERLIGIAVPAVLIASTGSYFAAILMGGLTAAITSFGRARFTTNSRVVHATRDHLKIVATDGSTKSVPWERVVAIECWRSIDSRTDLLIHVSTDVGLGQDVFRVWARESSDTVRKFLECCRRARPIQGGSHWASRVSARPSHPRAVASSPRLDPVALAREAGPLVVPTASPAE